LQTDVKNNKRKTQNTKNKQQIDLSKYKTKPGQNSKNISNYNKNVKNRSNMENGG